MNTATATIVSSCITLLGVIIVQIVSVITSTRKNEANNEKAMIDIRKESEKNFAVYNEKIEELTREVRSHNDFGRRIPVLEEQIKVANHRIEDLERNEKKGA